LEPNPNIIDLGRPETAVVRSIEYRCSIYDAHYADLTLTRCFSTVAELLVSLV